MNFLDLMQRDAVSESDLEQLNAYVGYYKKNEMTEVEVAELRKEQ